MPGNALVFSGHFDVINDQDLNRTLLRAQILRPNCSSMAVKIQGFG